MNKSGVAMERWRQLQRWTPARVALGRVGASTPTEALLKFNADHAHARAAIHTPFNTEALTRSLEDAGFRIWCARSKAITRADYLLRPDLGRSLHPDCVASLQTFPATSSNRLTVIVADGLSALAPACHALPLLLLLRDGLTHWELDDIVLATQARVALADEIGELRGSEATLMLLGERPGLDASDSLGAYLTYHPRPGRTDADRNCVSNIRHGGLPYEEAAARLLHLLSSARTLGATGIALKDDSDRGSGAIR